MNHQPAQAPSPGATRPWPIITAMLLATLANHGVAAETGARISGLVAPGTLRWLVAVAFILMGLWILVPDKTMRPRNIRTAPSSPR